MTQAVKKRSLEVTTETESQYNVKIVKKSHLEQILHRPGMYIGSTQPMPMSTYVQRNDDAGSNGKPRFAVEVLDVVQGLTGLLDELIVNVADMGTRFQAEVIRCDIEFDESEGTIRVANSGKNQYLPVVKHDTDTEKYVPEIALFTLNTSSNYDDSIERLTGGRNGYGAKLVSIFSTHVELVVNDPVNGKTYTQLCSNNMKTVFQPKVTAFSNKTGMVSVKFTPDLARFGIPSLKKNGAFDMGAMIKRRAFELLVFGSDKLSVFYNGEKLSGCGTPKEFVEAHLEQGAPYVYTECEFGEGEAGGKKGPARWKVAVAASTTGYSQISFVNGIHTKNGGTHVDLVCKAVVKAVAQKLSSLKSLGAVKETDVKQRLQFFIWCLIDKPDFRAQLKDELILKPASFGSKFVLPERWAKDIVSKFDIVDILAALTDARTTVSAQKQTKTVKAADGAQLVTFAKLSDAVFAKHRKKRAQFPCSLIVVEGDSAKALAISGRSAITDGHNVFGIFPLRGKCMNIRDKDALKKLIADKEGKSELVKLMKIIGLVYRMSVASLTDLRYQQIVIMTDQDVDGIHIFGLVYNAIQVWCPDVLAKYPNFVSRFITPLVRVHSSPPADFFSENDFRNWMAARPPGAGALPRVQFLKGLGSSTPADGKGYFRNLPKHLVPFEFEGEACERKLELAFGKDADARKDWITELGHSDGLNYAVGRPIKLARFVDEDLVKFSAECNHRQIPDAMDGLCPAGRKVLYGMRHLGLYEKKRKKVSQLAGLVSALACYHHGEASLTESIVRMAQQHVGTNNISYLIPDGQFGSRNDCKKVHAAPRYLSTCLERRVTETIFSYSDDALLPRVEDDGQQVEPVRYMPVVPMCLVNGVNNVSVGWSTYIPQHNPVDVVDATIKLLRHPEASEQGTGLVPWYRGFTGSVARHEDGSGWTLYGTFEWTGRDLHVTELPPETWTDVYIERLQSGKLAVVVENRSSDLKVDLLIKDARGAFKEDEPVTDAMVYAKFGLQSKVATTYMNLIVNGKIHLFPTTHDIVCFFVERRLPFYRQRLESERAKTRAELDRLNDRIVVIDALISGDLEDRVQKNGRWAPRPKGDILADAAKLANMVGTDEAGLAWVMRITLQEKTEEHIAALRLSIEKQRELLEALQATNAKKVWHKELLAAKSAFAEYKPYGQDNM